MIFRLFLLFTLLPVLELVLLIEIGRKIGTLPAILLVLGTGILGTLLAKSQGLGVIHRMGMELNAGRLPAEELVEGFFILVGGILLATPGIMTDLAGFFLLFPLSRHWLKEKTRLKIYQWVKQGTVRLYVR
jgi:UPF0716 protein FxsA